MATPVWVDILSFFYPIGNTSAVHLTRNLPREQAARILLLGCGDIRNIVFTIYMDQDSGRSLDFTCCDIQPDTIGRYSLTRKGVSRNILLLTLALDDIDGGRDALMWNIYYHVYIDNESMKLVSDQATKLYEMAMSMHSWTKGKYGQQFRFCDEGTLSKVRAIWYAYRVASFEGEERERYAQRSMAAMKRATSAHEYYIEAGSYPIGAIRAAAPAGVCAVKDAPMLNLQKLFANLSQQSITNNSLLRYNRRSFALFLRFVRHRVICNWTEVMDRLLASIEKNSSLMMGLNCIQELYLYLHIYEVHSVDAFEPAFARARTSLGAAALKGWKNIPPVLFVTIKVPREKLGVLTREKPTDIATPILHCIVQSSPSSPSGQWQNIFSAIQLSFGTISTSGERFSDTFRVHIAEDKLRWNGSSPLLATFMAPTWMLLLEPKTAKIAFGIQSTPANTSLFMKAIGVDMNLYATDLGNQRNVFFTRSSPNLDESTSLCALSDGNSTNSVSSNAAPRTLITAKADPNTGKIASLVVRLETLSEDMKKALKNGCSVETEQMSPVRFMATLGSKPITLDFPAPVTALNHKTRVARKSFYIELQEANMCHITVDSEELNLWKQALPALVERCRTWKHQADCEYSRNSNIPLSMEEGQRVFCSCGNGRFPPDFIKGVPQWSKVSKYFVRAAVSLCFQTPFSEPLFDFGQLRKSHGCQACGKEKTNGGGALLSCAKCHTAKYCSADCQRADWKSHKRNCRAPS
ncbi:MYND finger [Pyrenophora seminiperda CCB06]|uniref:MYND finger n=1 Tax=Pyrenophora seminiperda CCB06 TaxID=1302712 RepID=A0A3M7LZS8_9PLEO|nr:MYND finger [Pyrenophora seminiperda CCB06]